MKKFLFTHFILISLTLLSTACFYPRLKSSDKKLGESSGATAYSFQSFGLQFGLSFPGVNSTAGNDNGTNVVMDSLGNTYITLNSDGNFVDTNGGSTDAILMKISPAGTVIWARQFTPAWSPLIVSATMTDMPIAMTLDNNENIIVAGNTSSNLAGTPGANLDVWVAKVSPLGELTWIKQFSPAYSSLIINANGSDAASGVSADQNGNIYLFGHSSGSFAAAISGPNDAWIAGLNSSGDLSWIKALNPAYSGSIISAAGSQVTNGSKTIASTSSGRTCFAGATNNTFVTALDGVMDVFVGSTDSAGNLLWIRQLTNASFPAFIASAAQSDMPTGVALDSEGNCYLHINTSSDMVVAVGGSSDSVVAKFDSSGNMTMLKQITPALSPLVLSNAGMELTSTISVDSLGNIYASGSTNAGFAAPIDGMFDKYIYKIDSSGSLVWIKQLNFNVFPSILPGATNDSGGISFTDRYGNSSITGQSSLDFFSASGGAIDAHIMHIDSNGN